MSTITKTPAPNQPAGFNMPAQIHLGSVHLRVEQLDRSVAFYSDLLGIPVRERRKDEATFSANGTDDLLVLRQLSAPRPKPHRATGLYHFAILFARRQDLGRALIRLAQARYPLQGASDHLVSEALYLADPDGNGIELYWDRPRAVWPRMGSGVRMDTLPLDLDALIREGQKADEWSQVPASTTMGHVHLHVAHIAAAETFYRQALGFDLMMNYGGSAIFLAAGGYHHHLGANIWAGVGAPPAPADAPGLAHWTIHLPAQADLDALTAHLDASDVAYSRLAQGIMLADPSGNRVAVLAK